LPLSQIAEASVISNASATEQSAGSVRTPASLGAEKITYRHLGCEWRYLDEDLGDRELAIAHTTLQRSSSESDAVRAFQSGEVLWHLSGGVHFTTSNASSTPMRTM
jgi:hypothetical protein